MGVTKFFTWIKLKYKDCITDEFNKRGHVDSFYIDMNYIIHLKCGEVYRYGKNEKPFDDDEIEELKKYNPEEIWETVFERITDYLRHIISIISPAKLLMIAVDGVAPRSKINQQRSRRYVSAIERYDSTNRAFELFDPNSISPGTPFMDALSKYLQEWILNTREHLPPRVIYSSHRVPGEGEHKINKMISIDTPIHGRILYKQTKTEGWTVVYGSDADQIILGLNSRKLPYMIMRENDKYTDDNDIEIYERNFEKEFLFVDIQSIRQKLLEYMNSSDINDFVLITILLGNDFLPVLPEMENLITSLNSMLLIYRNLKTKNSLFSLTRMNDIHWGYFKLFLSALVERQGDFLANRIKYNEILDKPLKALSESVLVHRKKGVETFTIDIQSFTEKYYKKIFKIWDTKYYSLTYEDTIQSNITEMCDSWFEMCIWILAYYNYGYENCNSSLAYKFIFPPTLGSLFDAINANVVKDTLSANCHWKINATGLKGVVFSPIEQLMSILPPASFHLLPIEVQEICETKLFDMYPTHIEIDDEGKKDTKGLNKHKYITILPIVSTRRIIDAFKSLKIKGITKLNAIEKDKYF